MEFTKYRTITNHSDEKFIEAIKNSEYADPNIDWIVTEKIHGANFSFSYDGETVKPGKRSGYIKNLQGFNNCEKVVKALEANIIKAWDVLSIYRPDMTDLVIYGEYYGGMYDHPDVEKVPNARKVQKGVHYSPDNHFAAFDIKVNGEYVPYKLALDIFFKAEIPSVPILLISSFDFCIQFSNEFQSQVGPMLHNLPEIKDNLAEGYVLKPYDRNAELPNGKRMIVKSKSPKFSERKQQKRIRTNAPVVLLPEAQNVCDLLCTYATENRVYNVLSHGHTLTKKDFNKLLGLTTNDMMKEFMSENGDSFRALSDDERKEIARIAQNELKNAVRTVFLKEICTNA